VASDLDFTWYDAGRFSFALAAGVLLIPLTNQMLGGTAPCLIGDGCAVAEQFSRLIPWYLSPALLGVTAGFGLVILASLQQTARIAQWLGGMTALIAVGLQARLITSGVICSTCLIAAALFVLGSIVSWRKQFSAPSIVSPMIALVGLCLPLTLTLLLPKERNLVSRPTATSLGSVDRRELVEGRSSNQLVIVAFGSPMCPACRRELPEASRLATQLKAEFVYRFSPVKTGDRQEWSSAARLKEMVSRRYTVQWHAALSSPKMVLGSDEIILSREEVTEALRKTQLDEVIGKQIGLIQLPTVAICEPATPCREISLQELRELAR